MKYPTMRFVFDRKKVATKTHKGLVQIEVLSEGKRKWIGTGVKVYSDQWNDRKKIINSVEMIQLNQCLDEQLRVIQNWINELISKKEVFDFDKLDRFLRYTNKSESFVDFVERRIEERGDITESTKASHRTFAASLREFDRIIYFLISQKPISHCMMIGYMLRAIHSRQYITIINVTNVISTRP